MALPPIIAQAVLLLSFSCLVIGNVDDTVMPWASSQTGDSFTCEFGPPGEIISGTPFCYLPEQPEPIMARSEDLFLIRGGVVHGRKSAIWQNGTVVVSLNPLLARRSCVMCQWFHKTVHRQTCLACREMTVNRARHSDERHVATLVDTGAEIAASKQYFLCRFRVPRNSTGGQTAWLSERCLSSSVSDKRKSPTNPMDSCAISPSYIPLRRTGPYVVMRAKIRTEETCRVCMIRVNGVLTVGRACLDARMTTLIRDVKIGRLLVFGIWTTSLIVVIVSIIRFIYNSGIIQRCFKKVTMVRTEWLRLAVLACFWVNTVSGAVTISVPDTYVPDLIRPEKVLVTGFRLCFGAAIRDREETVDLLYSLNISNLLRTIDILASDPRAPGVHRDMFVTTTFTKTIARLRTGSHERKLMSIVTSMSSQKRSATKTLRVNLDLQLS
nr:membrane protein m133 [Murid betaherpesvirus 2]